MPTSAATVGMSTYILSCIHHSTYILSCILQCIPTSVHTVYIHPIFTQTHACTLADYDEVGEATTYTIEGVLEGFGLALKGPLEAASRLASRASLPATPATKASALVSARSTTLGSVGTSAGFSKRERHLKEVGQNLSLGHSTMMLIQNHALPDRKRLLRRIQQGRELAHYAERPFFDHPPLHRAILVNDNATIIRLIQLGAKPEQGSNVGEKLSAMQTAVISGNLDAARLFLQAGADVDFCFNGQANTIRKALRKLFSKMTKIQQDIDVLKVKISNSLDEEQRAFKNQMIRMRQMQLVHEEEALKTLEQKLSVEADNVKLNARAPLVLACLSKNPTMLRLLLGENGETEVGLPPLITDTPSPATPAQPIKLSQWCSQHFKLGARMLSDDVPESLTEYLNEPLYGVFIAWIHHYHHAPHHSDASTGGAEEDEMQGLKAEMSLEELIKGFQRFGLWPSEVRLKKLAVLGAGSDSADSISDNGLQKIFLTSLFHLLSAGVRRSMEDEMSMSQGLGAQEADSHTAPDISDHISDPAAHSHPGDASGSLDWHEFDRVWQRKLEKLFFSALQLEHGVGGGDGAYAQRDQALLKTLVHQAERQFRVLAAVLMLYQSSSELSVADIQRYLRRHELRLKCLNIDDDELDVLESELQEIAEDEEEVPPILERIEREVRGRRRSMNGKLAENGKPGKQVCYQCTAHEAPVQQLMLDYPQFRWVIEVVCKENLGGMSLGEFSRLVFLEKAVELHVGEHSPVTFRNLQDNDAHRHSHVRHTKPALVRPNKVRSVKLWGDIWGQVRVSGRACV